MIADASVVLKWVLDDGDGDLALQIAARADLAAPEILTVESAHVLTKLVRQHRIEASQASAAWLELSSANVRLVENELLLRPALALSLRLAASFYDCLYLALAVLDDDVLVTADERFVRAVRATPGLAHRIQSLTQFRV